MTNRRDKSHHIKTNASKRLRTNLRLLAVVYVILFFVMAYNLIVSQAVFWQVILAIVIGLSAGIISSRMYKISWNHHEAEVVGRIDIYGVIVLALFVLFELNRTHIAELFSSGESLGSISLVLVTSALFGRIVGTSKRILQILRTENII